MAVRQEAALLYVSHKAPDWNVVQDKFKVVQLLDGFTQLVYLRHKNTRSICFYQGFHQNQYLNGFLLRLLKLLKL